MSYKDGKATCFCLGYLRTRQTVLAEKSINLAADVQHGKFLTRAAQVWQSQKNVENPGEMHQAILIMGGVTTPVPRVSRTHQNQLFGFF